MDVSNNDQTNESSSLPSIPIHDQSAATSLDISRLPIVVQQCLISKMNGVDAISAMQVLGDVWPCSTSHFFKLLGAKYFSYELVECPKINDAIDMYHVLHFHFCQKRSMRKYRKIMWHSFTEKVLDRMCCQYYSCAFQCYVRLFSLTVHFATNALPLFDIFENYDLLKPRQLNEIELQLFKVSRCVRPDLSVVWTDSLLKFLSNLIDRFGYHEWHDAVNMDLFVQAGEKSDINSVDKLDDHTRYDD